MDADRIETCAAVEADRDGLRKLEDSEASEDA